MAHDLPDTLAPCWGAFTVPIGQRGTWHIYATELCADRGAAQWLLSWRQVDTEGLRFKGIADASSPLPSPPEAMGPRRVWARETDGQVRFATRRASAALELAPNAADRPVVARPDVPLHIAAGDEVRLYIGTPAWIDVSSEGVDLITIASRRLSDTWFGPVEAGELCYASRTTARTEVRDIDALPGRVLTPVTVRNRTSGPFPVERIKLPIPHLGVYGAEDGRLWTEGLTLESTEDAVGAVHFDGHAPDEAHAAKLVAKPRVARDRHKIIRTIGALFG